MADYSITGDTRLDASGFNKGLSAMSVTAGNLISGLVKTGTSKLAELSKASVGVGMSFQSSMSQVAATMGTSVDQIQLLTDKAKEMGSTTAFTATQAADALNYLALAGYDANKAAEVLPSVLNLAAAGGMDLAYASELVTDAMASLNLEATKQNVDEFGNKLAMAASKANANVAQLGEAILTVGGTAANLKEGTTELTTALGLLANVGIKGAEGGTHLRNIILSLQSPTDDATKLMQQLGLQVYDAQGNMRGLDDILTDLNSTMAGMTQGQKDSIVNQLFNKTDLAAVNGLLAAQGEQWEALAAQIGAAGEASGDSGAMAQMAQTQLDNLQGAVTIMQSALEGLQLGLYDYLEPGLTEAAKWGAECFSTLTSALTDGGPEAMLQAAGEIIAELAASISAQLPDLAGSAVEIIAQLSQDLTAAMPSILDTGAQVLSALITGITANLPQLLTSATEIVCSLVDYIGQHADEIIDAGVQCCEALVIGITENLPQLITSAAMLIANLAAALISHLPDILECGAALLTTLVDGILRSIENLGEAALACIGKLLGVWDGTMDEWGHIGENIVQGLLNGITGMWDSLVSSVKGKVSGMVDTVKGVLGIHSPSKVFSEIGVQTCAGLAQGLTRGNIKVKEAAKTVVASVTETATQINGAVTSVTETVTEQMANGTQQQKQTVTETSRQMVNGVLSDVKTITTTAADGSQKVQQSIEAVRDVVSTTKDTQTQLIDGVKVTVEKTTELLADGSERISTVTTRTGKEIIDGVERTVKTVTTKTADGVESTVCTIEDAGPQYASAGELLTCQFTEKLNSSWEQINKSIQSDVIGSIQTLFKAIQDGDLESIATWSAAYFWNACTQEQRTQIQTFALDALSKLSSSLSGVFQNVAGLASSFVSQFVPAVAAATTGQTTLNVAMDANPIMLVISLIGMLVGALVSFASTNKDVASGFQRVWQGVEDVISVVFEGMLRFIGLSVQGFVSAVNTIIDTYNWVADKLGLSTIRRVSNPLWDQADKVAAKRKENQAKRKASSEAKAAQAALDTQYAQDSGAAEKKQLEAEYAKKAAELAKAKLSSDSPGMLDAEKNVAAADYTKSLADLEKKLLDAQYKKATAELSKRTETDAAALAELEKQITEADNTIRSGDLEKELLRVNYEKTLKELEAKYQPKKDNTNSGSFSNSSSNANSDDLAAKINDLEKSYDQKLQELKNTYTNKSEAQSAEYERKLAAMKADYEKQLASMKNQLAESKTTYEKQLAELKKQHNSSSGSNKPAPTPEPSTPTLPDNTGAIEDNTAAILAANEKLAEMVRQANSLVLSDNMAVSRSVAASGTAQIAAAANNYHRDGDTNITQNIYSKAQTAADLARETRWEADRAKATKH